MNLVNLLLQILNLVEFSEQVLLKYVFHCFRKDSWIVVTLIYAVFNLLPEFLRIVRGIIDITWASSFRECFWQLIHVLRHVVFYSFSLLNIFFLKQSVLVGRFHLTLGLYSAHFFIALYFTWYSLKNCAIARTSNHASFLALLDFKLVCVISSSVCCYKRILLVPLETLTHWKLVFLLLQDTLNHSAFLGVV